ncbi:hypothetical protein BH20ACI3_BH20ACI3_19240 [soil metagenome]
MVSIDGEIKEMRSLFRSDIARYTNGSFRISSQPIRPGGRRTCGKSRNETSRVTSRVAI